MSKTKSKNGKFHKCCILLSGGIGTRMGRDVPKQYIEVCCRTIFEYTLRSILKWEGMDSLIVVADEAYHRELEFIIRNYIDVSLNAIRGEDSDDCCLNAEGDGLEDLTANRKIIFLGFSLPGENRQGSIINALSDIEPFMSKDAVIMIHDAVRPFVSKELLTNCDNKLKNADGVMPFLPMKDTIYESKKSEKNLIIDRNIDRDKLVAGQTPEFYNYAKYRKCCDELSERELRLIHGSTEPAVLGGLKVAIVPGDEENFKITTPNDLEKFTEIVEKNKMYSTDAGEHFSHRKTILYCINTASIIYHEDEMLDKMKRNFAIFNDSADDITLLWTVDKDFEKKMEISDASLKRKLKRLMNKNRFTVCGKYIDFDSAEYAVDSVDAYYGDWNYLAWKCQQLGKPVMIQNIEV